MSVPLAHSARFGCPSQTYEEHIKNVSRNALRSARVMLRHYRPSKTGGDLAPTVRHFLEAIGDGSSFHDLGKLDSENQRVLAGGASGGLPIRHEDAGVALLAAWGELEAAALVSSHHQGLVRYEFAQSPTLSRVAVRDAGLQRLAVLAFRVGDRATSDATDKRLQTYRTTHEGAVGRRRSALGDELSRFSGLSRRLMLSCLVDADHGDTARHYQQGEEAPPAMTRWAERLEALEGYIASMPRPDPTTASAAEISRQELRDALFDACHLAPTDAGIYSCNAVVGSGKTTAVMAHLLKVAGERKLRHIFVVLPYTNIIKQSVDVYRRALCLPGEDPETVVAEHHHQVEFKDVALRGMTTLWRAPIVVTTAVQFFETLAANSTSALRKLNELPGSAVFVDEAHAAMPSAMWPAAWSWLDEWVQEWNGHVVLASGSLPEFWTLPEFKRIVGSRDTRVRPISGQLQESLQLAESQRIQFRSIPSPLSFDELADKVELAQGPRLVIVNTVQTAAEVARRLAARNAQNIVHLSTALAPMDRELIVGQIKRMLREADPNWTLVATSLVEAGMDFSFGTGFRQRCSVASLIQTGGRVNRNSAEALAGDAWDFDFADSRLFPNNPSIKTSASALSKLIERKMFVKDDGIEDLAQACLQAMAIEFGPGTQSKARRLLELEEDMDYPEVASQFRLIGNESRTVLVDSSLAHRITKGYPVTTREIRARSVQMYANKIDQIGVEPVLGGREDLYVLPDGWSYDAQGLGYMAGWFERERSIIPGAYFV